MNFQPLRCYALTDYSQGKSPKPTERRWMSEAERDQAQSQMDPACCLMWEPVPEIAPRLCVQELLMAVCSFYCYANAEQFAEATQSPNPDLYLRFSQIAIELGDFPIAVLEQVVEAYYDLVKAEASSDLIATPASGRRSDSPSELSA